MSREWWKIYTRDNCSWCVKAKELLQVHGIDYHEVNISEDRKLREQLKEEGFKTVPIIFREDDLIGGYEDLSRYFERKIANGEKEKHRKPEA